MRSAALDSVSLLLSPDLAPDDVHWLDALLASPVSAAFRSPFFSSLGASSPPASKSMVPTLIELGALEALALPPAAAPAAAVAPLGALGALGGGLWQSGPACAPCAAASLPAAPLATPSSLAASPAQLVPEAEPYDALAFVRRRDAARAPGSESSAPVSFASSPSPTDADEVPALGLAFPATVPMLPPPASSSPSSDAAMAYFAATSALSSLQER